MNNEEKDLKEQSNSNQIDMSAFVETFNKTMEMIKPIFETLAKTFKEIWEKVNGKTLLIYARAAKEAEYKYIKKGKRYVKVRRKNSEDISRAFSRKVKHYKKQIQRSLSSKWNDWVYLSRPLCNRLVLIQKI